MIIIDAFKRKDKQKVTDRSGNALIYGVATKHSVFFPGLNKVNAVFVIEDYFFVERFGFFGFCQYRIVKFCQKVIGIIS